MHPERWTERVTIAAPGAASPLALAFARRLLAPLVRLAHRATFEGAERLPASGPFLLVANHSGGLALAEIQAFIALWVGRFGGSRPIAGFAHPVGFGVWPLSWALRQVGAIPSSYRFAEQALGAGVPILVFPGGDHEAMRPVWQANRVDFGGRRGFLKIAARAWVPVVPLGVCGSHFTAPLLFRSRLLAYVYLWPWLAGVKRWSLSLLNVLGVAGILAWAPLDLPWRLLLAWVWSASPLTMVPWVPWRIRMRFGAPLAPEALFGERGAPDLEQKIDAALPAVEAAVQALVTPGR